jgi:hypothetical protein
MPICKILVKNFPYFCVGIDILKTKKKNCFIFLFLTLLCQKKITNGNLSLFLT